MCLPLKNRFCFSTRCSSTLTLLLKEVLTMIFLNADTILASSFSKSWKTLRPLNWLRCHKIVRWSCHLHFIDPWHCELRERWTHTHFGLEVDFPTLKVIWVREFSEMQVRDSVPRRFHHTILRLRSSNMIQRIPRLVIHGKSRSRYCWPLRFSSQSFSISLGISSVTWPLYSQGDDVKFVGVFKNDGDGPSGAGRSSKTFPWVPIEFRIVRQARIAANHPSGTRNSRGMTGNVEHSGAARCLRITEFFVFIQGSHLVLYADPENGQKLIHGKEILFLLQKSSYILNCLTLSACLQQILRNSCISWQSLAWCSWKILFFVFNSQKIYCCFSLWAWSAHWFAWYSSNLCDSSCWLVSQRAISEPLSQHGKHMRDHSQSTVSQLYDILDERHCILYLRNMLATFRQTSQIKQRSLWCFVDSKLRDKERPILRCTSRKHREAKNLSRSSRLSQKCSEKGVQIHIGQISE